MAIREKIILEGEDRASKSFDQAGGSFERMGKTLKKVAIGGGLAIAGVAAARVSAKLVGMAVDAEEAESAFNTAFGTALPEASAFVEEFALKAGFATHELQQLLAITGTVVQGIGATEAESAALSETMARLAGDVASFSNAQGGAEAVMLALQSAINGEREALKTYGLAISEAEVQSLALLTTEKTRADELTRLEKAQATVEIAAIKAGKAMGDLDRTQNSAANTMRRLGAMAREAGTKVGQKLLPAVEAILPILEDLIPVAEDAGRAMASVVTSMALVGAAAAPTAVDWLARLAEGFDRVLAAGAGAGALVAEIWTLGGADTSGLKDFQATVRHAAELVDISEKLRKGQVPGRTAAIKYANAIAELGRRADLSTVGVATLASASDASEEGQLNALVRVLDMAQAEGWRRDNLLVLTDAIVTQKIELGLWGDSYDDAGLKMLHAADAASTLPPVLREVDAEFEAAAEAALEARDAAAEAADAFREDMLDAAKEFITGFEKLPDKIDATMAEFETNLTKRIAAQEAFWINLTILARHGFDDLAEAIREEGPAAASLLEEMVADMETAARLEDAIDNAAIDMESLIRAYARGLDTADISIEAYRFGQQTIDSIIEGLRSRDVPSVIEDEVRTPRAHRPHGGFTVDPPKLHLHSGTWDVPGTGPIDATIHGGEAVIPSPGSSGRADFARALAAELQRAMPDRDANGEGGNHVTIEQITVLVPAGTTITEAITAAGAQAAIEALMS